MKKTKKFIKLTSNRSRKRIALRKEQVDIVYEQEDTKSGDTLIKGVVSLSVKGLVYEVKESFDTVMDGLGEGVECNPTQP